MTGHSVWLQLLWVTVSWVGIAVSVLALLDALGDRWHAILMDGPAERRRLQIAAIAIRNELARLFSQSAFLGLATVVPMAPPSESWCCLYTGFVLMIVSSVMTGNALLARRSRRTLIREAIGQERAGET